MPVKLRKAGQELALSPEPNAGVLLFASNVEDAVREADVAIDFVPDELESKLEIFSLLDRMAPPKTILCTPTKTLSISDLASCTYRGDRCVALEAHGREVNADHLRVVKGRGTSAAVVQAVAAWFAALGTTVEVYEDSRG